jgi:hypothetical protein
MRLAAVLLLLLTACARGILPPPARAGDYNTRLASRVVEYTSEVKWRQSPFWRMADQPEYPWVVVYSGNVACPVFRQLLRIPREQELFQCPIQWRSAQ